MPRRAVPVAARMQQLQRRVEEWRQRRPYQMAMPAALWSEAVALAEGEGAYRVARALRINFEGLKRRMAEAAVGAPTPTPAFLDLPMPPLLGAPLMGGAVVEMQDRDGTRVVMQLAKDATVDVAQVVSAFRRRGA